MYESVTRAVRVSALATFLSEQSRPEEHRYVWAYTIHIRNEGWNTVQLLSRHWRVTDGHGKLEEVRGAGVVGQQPILSPRQLHHYQSRCILDTPEGTMTGTYRMVALETCEFFDIAIPLFPLLSPHARGTAH